MLVLHGAVNRAIFSYALTGQRMFLGHFEQSAGCLNVIDVGDEWIVRAVNVSPTDPAHRADAEDDDGGILGALRGSRDDLPDSHRRGCLPEKHQPRGISAASSGDTPRQFYAGLGESP